MCAFSSVFLSFLAQTGPKNRPKLDPRGIFPIHVAAENGDANMVEMLIKEGYRPLCASWRDRLTEPAIRSEDLSVLTVKRGNLSLSC